MPTPDIKPVEGGDFLIATFWRLRDISGSDFAGPAPIKPQDIVGWSDLTGMPLRPEEKTALLRMDAAFRRACSLRDGELNGLPETDVEAEPLTADKFKALFGAR